MKKGTVLKLRVIVSEAMNEVYPMSRTILKFRGKKEPRIC